MLVRKNSISLILLTAVLLQESVNYVAASNHCDRNVVVESVELFNYLGNVTFAVPTAFNGVWNLDLQTSGPFSFIGGWGIRIQTGDPPLTHATIISVESVQLQPGDVISFRYRIYWESCAAMPTVIGLRWENHIICDVRSTNEISGEDNESPGC